MFIQKDLETVKNVFKLLDKAVWNSVDGDQIVLSYKTFVDLKLLEDKIQKALNTPEVKPEPKEVIPEPPKKGKKNASK